MTEDDIRTAIIKEADSWFRTPWHHEARVKGAGIDCGLFLFEVFERCGLVPHVDVPHYGMDFMRHSDEEWFLNYVLTYADEIDSSVEHLPGDIILFKIGKLYSHGAIIHHWPIVMHASRPDRCVCYADVSKPHLSEIPMKFFRYRGLK